MKYENNNILKNSYMVQLNKFFQATVCLVESAFSLNLIVRLK